MKILLSPAKSIDPSRNIAVPHTNVCRFIKQADYLMQQQRKLSPKELAKLLSISENLATNLHQRNSKWEYPDSLSQNVKPCITVFTGEVYRGLDVTSWTQQHFQIADNTLRILSGMYGVLKPLDLLYPYRLEMGTKWKLSEKINNLYAFWNEQLVDNLLSDIQEGEKIVNLASAEYFKAVDFAKIHAYIVSVQFLDFIHDRYKTIAVYTKKARGKMASFAVQNNIINPEELKLYAQDGYCFDANLSSDNNWVFTR